MRRHTVNSSSIAEVGYDSPAQILEVQFHGGRVYRYFDVPSEVFCSLMDADSMGSFLNRRIKGTYRYRPEKR